MSAVAAVYRRHRHRGADQCPPADLDPLARGATIAAVPQEGYLFSGSIGMNIASPRPDATAQDIHQAAVAAGLTGMIGALPDGYDTLVGEGGTALSGGERQRIAIARALLKDAPVTLLDEITAAVDTVAEQRLRAAGARRLSTGAPRRPDRGSRSGPGRPNRHA